MRFTNSPHEHRSHSSYDALDILLAKTRRIVGTFREKTASFLYFKWKFIQVDLLGEGKCH